MASVNARKCEQFRHARRLDLGALPLVIVFSIFAIFILAGCSSRDQTQAAFSTIDKAVSDANIGSVARLIADTKYGRVSISSDPPTRRLVLLSDQTADQLRGGVEAKLTDAGFSKDGGTWSRGSGKDQVVAIVDVVGAGEDLPEGTDPAKVPAHQNGVVVRFINRSCPSTRKIG